MPSPTPELGLLKGVDADDTADYLVTSLASSLTTVDGLFNSTTGHNHGGAHQGGPLAAGSIHNSALASDVARANLLTNGGFEIWQRGTSFSSITTDTIHADMWHTSPGAGSSFTTVQATPTAGFTDNSPRSYGATYVHSAPSNVYQKVEGFGSLAARTVSLSIRVRTSTANAVQLFVQDGPGSTYTSAAHPGDNAWHTLTLTVAVQASPNQLTIALQLSASCTFYADNAMLVVGSQPADYAPLHPADDLARCLRYYERMDGTNTNQFLLTQAYVATGASWLWPMKIQKAAAPTITTAAPAQFAQYTAAAGTIAVTSITTGFATPDRAGGGTTTVSGLVAGNASFLLAALGASAAYMIAEANP